MKAVKTVLMSICLTAMFMLSVCYAEDNDKSDSASLLKKADGLFKSNDYQQALDIYVQSADRAKGENDNSVLTEAYSQVARCYLGLERKEEGRPWLEKARELASEDDPAGWSRFLSVKGRFQWKDAAAEAKEVTPVADDAAATFKQMYDYCEAHGLHERAVDAANMVSLTGKMDERTAWALKGIEAAEKGNFEGMLGPLWNNLGWTYDDQGRYDESLKALEKARIYHYKRGNELSMLIADWAVGHALRMTGQIDSAETVMRNVQKWALIKKSEEKSPDNSEWVGWSNLEMAEIVLLRGDRDRALGLLQVAYSNLKEAGMNDWDPERLEQISKRILEISGPRK